jgi:zinc transport system substrate-binding protein
MSRISVIGIAAVAIALTVAVGLIDHTSGQSLQQHVPSSNETEKIRVIASFFPLYDFATNVGGDRAEVSIMVPAGIEPHDWEPTPRDIENAENANMIVYNGAGFESWISDINANFSVDTSRGIIQSMEREHEDHEEDQVANMTSITSTNATAATNATTTPIEEIGHEHHEHEEHDIDPHFWLDPVLAQQQVVAIRDGFVQIDPVNSEYYNQNAQRYIAELDSLDSFIRSELSNCTINDFITFHDAFSYFANRYGLTQHSVHGLSPQGEVLPQRIQEIKDLATSLDINVIYAEDLIDPRLAEVIAGEIPNGQVLVLSPIEGLEVEEIEQGLGYIDKMRENIENLKVGLRCL